MQSSNSTSDKKPVNGTRKLKLEEGVHFYYNEQGYMVFTELYLTLRGYCCGNGCKHCPYPKKN
jgi:hypothetical protein